MLKSRKLKKKHSQQNIAAWFCHSKSCARATSIKFQEFFFYWTFFQELCCTEINKASKKKELKNVKIKVQNEPLLGNLTARS